MKVTLKVTAEHISKGSRSNCQRCPVALALRDIIDPAYVVTVGCSGMSMGKNGRLDFSSRTPESVKDFIYQFDCYKSVQPFEAKLDIPRYLLAS